MLRKYKPIAHDIFKLQDIIRTLVLQVWCNTSGFTCESLVRGELKILYDKYEWLKEKIDAIHEACEGLGYEDKFKIKQAFETNNCIEELCKGTKQPVHLDELPEVVEQLIKPLFVDFYNDLLDKAKVPGTKMDYYEKLVDFNEFSDCPCCGLIPFEPSDSDRREAFDHYLPKALYPFASVNFSNLVPLCYKCNSDRKKTKDPIEQGRKAYYPFGDYKKTVEINVRMDKKKDLRKLEKEEMQIAFINETEEDETWDALFDIKKRYNEKLRQRSRGLLRSIKKRYRTEKTKDQNASMKETMHKMIEEFTEDQYDDIKFLKIPFMKDLLNSPHLIEVYTD